MEPIEVLKMLNDKIHEAGLYNCAYVIETSDEEAIYQSLSSYYSIPFSEYHEFHKWMKDIGWYEASDMEYDNENSPNSCFRLSISEVYTEFKMR